MTRRNLVAWALTALAVPAMPASAGILYANDDLGNLFTVDIATGAATKVGNTGTVLNDIAWDRHGNLYGVDYSNLYRIDPADGTLTTMGSLSSGPVVALVFDENGTLWGAGNDLLRIDPGSGQATVLCSLWPHAAAGDLALDSSWNLYVTTYTGFLLQIDRASGEIVNQGPIPDRDVYGFARAADGALYGITYGNMLLRIEPATGLATPVRNLTGDFLGGTLGSSFTDEAIPEPMTLLLVALATPAILPRKSRLA